MTYQSAFDRLSILPNYFYVKDLEDKFGFNAKESSLYLQRWQKQGLVTKFGTRSDVVANNRKLLSVNYDIMLRMQFPNAVVVGVEALRRAGLVTQIERQPTAAVFRQGYVKTDKFNLMNMPRAWFDAYLPHTYQPLEVENNGKPLTKKQLEVMGPRVLRPEYALAMLVTEYGWGNFGLDKDDIDDIDEMLESTAWHEANEVVRDFESGQVAHQTQYNLNTVNQPKIQLEDATISTADFGMSM